jgi:RimJ/RimL family protein N-acetyltransferase
MDDPPEGEAIRLVDVTPDTLGTLEELRRAEAGGFNDFGDQPRRPGTGDEFVDGRLRNERGGRFFVVRREDDAIVGTIQYRQSIYGPATASRAWMLGIEMAPDARGRGLGTEAQRLLAAWLFETTDATRVEASTDIENAAEARALEKAGFRREGVVRGAQFRAGAYHDLVLFGKLRSDPR